MLSHMGLLEAGIDSVGLVAEPTHLKSPLPLPFPWNECPAHYSLTPP